MTNEKGFTTIELILAIAIAGIIMGAVGTYLTFNLKSFNATTDVINVQYEGQLALNQITEIAKQSTGVMEVGTSSNHTAYMSTGGKVTPYHLVFIHESKDASNPTTTYTLTYDDTNNLINVNVKDASIDEDYMMASSISSFEIETKLSTVNFNDTDRIQVYISLRDGDATLDLQTHVQFRNKR